ncbi:hypothetical protein PY650_23910 [Rhizobium calliandrae]|uniref:Uncharacterized protein n=1 Tax=Rhizobium calliandrae TaxID=1312182 RepID=A0ABT7KKW3_9HYPH|nr:hypothetical protein [Rhizobium calliandrae]MDL2408635.1 hypothetical protein [Rhizobium calliandrae]
MLNEYISAHNQPLDTLDLNICQRAFDTSLFQLNIGKDTEEAGRLAALIIRLFQQGVRNERQLVSLVSASRSKLYGRSL